MSTSLRSSGPVGLIKRLADPDVIDRNLRILNWLEGIKRARMARNIMTIRKNPTSITVEKRLSAPTRTVPKEGSALMTPPPTSTSRPSDELRKDATTLSTASNASASPSAAAADDSNVEDDAGAPVNRGRRKRRRSMSHDGNGKRSPSSLPNNQNKDRETNVLPHLLADEEDAEPPRCRPRINLRERTIQRVQGVNTAQQSGERPLRRILRINFGKPSITLIRRRA